MCSAYLRMGMILAATCGSSASEERHDPVADPKAVVVSGGARFTVLTPELIRMEWSADGRFEDRASKVFVNRRLPVPNFTTDRGDEAMTIRTDRLTVRYTGGGRKFDERNLSVTFKLKDKAVVWKPGTKDTGNLGGTYRTLDGVSGGIPMPPGLLSRDGWVLIDDSKREVFDRADGTDRPWVATRDGKDAVDWYFFGYGHDYTKALKDHTRVAGRIPLPPRFAFGTWWSRYWAYSDAELRQLVRDFHEHDVPLDVLVVDMDWHLDGWTGYTWNPEYFPDPDGFLRWVRGQGLKVTLNLHPASGVGKHEKAFGQVARHMGLDPDKIDKVPFDCTDPRYVEAYFKYLHHPMERQGVDFWWIDWQQGTRWKSARLPDVDPLWWLNHLHWTDMERNPERGGKRPMLFSRWGKLGGHRYQVGFSGDTHCNWESLAFQPHFTSTAGNVCFPFWSHDIGGHMPGPVEPELYTRWVQWGALSPILRTHTTKNPAAERRLWKFPPEAFAAMRAAFHLRYELIPYIYTSARQCYDDAVPLCRPLYHEWPEYDEAYQFAHTYLFGDQLLVAPVLRPASELTGWSRVDLWIPPGEWTHWFQGKTYRGPASISLLTPPDEIPIFVRSGGIIATQPKMRHTGEKPVDPLILHIWPGESGKTRIYEDDGATVGYQKGEFAWTPVSHEFVDGERRITIGPVEGSYPGMLTERRYEIRLRDVAPSGPVWIDDEPLGESAKPNETGWRYDSKTFSMVIRVPRRLTPERTRIRVRDPSHPSAAYSRLYGRAWARTMVSTKDSLAEDEDPWQMGTKEWWRPNIRAYPSVVKSIQVAEIDADLKRRLTARILGLDVETRITGGSDEPTKVIIQTDIRMMPQSPEGIVVNAELEASDCPGWKWTTADSATIWDQQRSATSMISTLTPQDGPQTAEVVASLKLRCDEFSMDIPIRRVLLPSINRWQVIGPFDAEYSTAFDKEFPPEKTIDLDSKYVGKNRKRIGWKPVERRLTPGSDVTGEFVVDFHGVFQGRISNAVAYAVAYLESPDDRDVVLALGTDDGTVVWLNGKEVHRFVEPRAYRSKQDRIPIRLNKGTNTLLIKVAQKTGGWEMAAHVETADGEPVPDVTTHLKPSPDLSESPRTRPGVRWVSQVSGTTASLRGLSVVNRNVAWASGAGGTVVRTSDGGNTWHASNVPGAEALDFRDVQAFDPRTAILLSAGEPAKIYKTTDGGQSWTERYANETPGVFFDAMAFWDRRHGIAFSDPIDGRLLIITTDDAGDSWRESPKDSAPATLDGEAGFAASGTCLAVQGQSNVWIGLGGAAARVLRSTDRGRTWNVSTTPILSGAASRGIFSIAFRDDRHGVIVGGDYQQELLAQGNVAWTDDGGMTWTLVTDSPPAGYRSCVAYVAGIGTPTWVAVGPTGSDISTDDGRTWRAIGTTGYHAVAFAADGTGWAIGANGSLARIDWPD